MDEEFNVHYNELADSEFDMTAEENVDFYVETAETGKGPQVKACVTEYLRKGWGDLNEAASDNNDDKDDDDDVNSKKC